MEIEWSTLLFFTACKTALTVGLKTLSQQSSKIHLQAGKVGYVDHNTQNKEENEHRFLGSWRGILSWSVPLIGNWLYPLSSFVKHVLVFPLLFLEIPTINILCQVELAILCWSEKILCCFLAVWWGKNKINNGIA